MNNNKGAFGWPKGTVRAILGIEVITGILVLLFCILAFDWQVPEMVVAFIGSLIGSGSTIIGFYFGKKAGEEKPEK